eukprot:gene9505-5633_t
MNEGAAAAGAAGCLRGSVTHASCLTAARFHEEFDGRHP